MVGSGEQDYNHASLIIITTVTKKCKFGLKLWKYWIPFSWNGCIKRKFNVSIFLTRSSLWCRQPTQVSALKDVHNKPLLKAGAARLCQDEPCSAPPTSPRLGVLSYLLRANVGYLDWELTADSCFWILVLERCESVAPGAGLVQDIKGCTERPFYGG